MNNNHIKEILPIKTERLTIDKTTSSDIGLLLKLDKQEETQKYLGGVKNKSQEERLDFLKNKEYKLNNNLSIPLTIYLNNNAIGFIELKNIDSIQAEISYIFDYDYWNYGYCTEASLNIIENIFNTLDIKSIIAHTVKENINSIRVLEKIGFKYIKETEKDNVIFLLYEINRVN